MQQGHAGTTIDPDLPSWVPEAAVHYIVHTETGIPIRAIARRAGRHASTVMRQIRTCETRRDDLLVDQALRRLGKLIQCKGYTGSPAMESLMTNPTRNEAETDHTLSEDHLKLEAMRILRRLCEPGAVLAVSAAMDKAVVVRENGAGAEPSRTAIIDRKIAEAMALNHWIHCDQPGRISRYLITSAGRTALGQILAERENEARGRYDSGDMAPQATEDRGARPSSSRTRYGTLESPILALARRRDRDGQPFLSDDLVRAGERLREDFELSHMSPRVTQNWDNFLCHVDMGRGGRNSAPGFGAEPARDRVIAALRDLGPGLGDMVLRCCCYLEGLERAEKRMGWSARSGKIVLRIALQRLKRHYDQLGDAGNMIG